jgi:hypothetical protein
MCIKNYENRKRARERQRGGQGPVRAVELLGEKIRTYQTTYYWREYFGMNNYVLENVSTAALTPNLIL